MIFHNGTPQVMKLFNKLQVDGNLVNVYSQEFFDRNPNYQGFYVSDLEYVLDIENGSNDEYDPDIFPLNHLIFVRANCLSEEDRESLNEVYSPLMNVLRNDIHLPNFLLINLYTKQILAIGLGRKNRLFCIDVETNKSINPIEYVIGSDDFHYMMKFTGHDALEFISDLTGALHEMGLAFFEQDHLPFINDLHALLDSEPNAEGLYELDGYDDGVTRQEAQEMIEQYDAYQTTIDKNLKFVQYFFPEISEGDLNSGDY
jgi:predicted nucleotidyltransferase